jgi:flavin reductase (DIM6/NTAB) family NADH-FMN oxidoreductase RutF
MDVPLEECYRLIAPRVTVLITTVDKEGRINAAPISFVMPVKKEPPILAFSTGYGGDTYQNIEETGEFVVNLATESIMKQIYVCGESFPHGVNELEKAGLKWEPSEKVKPPRVVECPANLECKLEWMHKGDASLIIAGRVVAAKAVEGALKDGVMDAKKIKPLLHLSGKSFVVGDHVVGL